VLQCGIVGVLDEEEAMLGSVDAQYMYSLWFTTRSQEGQRTGHQFPVQFTD
jgi:hypothetical protein